VTRMSSTRRLFLQRVGGIAGVAGILRGAHQPQSAERYQLGCQTLPYRTFSLARALEGIRKAGYRYVMPTPSHQGKPVFTPELTAPARAELRRQISDAGLIPFMSFYGLAKGMTTPEGLKLALAEIDLCVEFGIRTVVGIGPWYYTKGIRAPKRAKDWEKEVDVFYEFLEKAVRHAESVGVTITLKPHTGITAHAKACLEVVKRLPSERLKICWDAGNVSAYEGIYPDPDLPDLAPHVKAVCVKDHKGGRGEANFPVPGMGQIDHELMFRTLFEAGFNGPIALERADGTDKAAEMPAELIDQRITQAREYLGPLLERLGRG
jgi:sugar phosphate isomerase/epimerase